MASYTALFGHFKSKTALTVGTTVKQATMLGIEGKTGTATGIHCHIAVAEGKHTSLDKMRLTPLNKGNPKPSKVQCESLLTTYLYNTSYKISTPYLDPAYTKEFGIKHPAIDVYGNGSSKVQWPLSVNGTVVALGTDGAYGNYIMIHYEIDTTIGTPVSRNENVDQLEIKISDLNVRDKATTSGKVLGYGKKGIYNYTKTSVANNYTWCQIEENKWIAYDREWVNLFPKKDIPLDPKDEEIIKLKNEINELNYDLETKRAMIEALNSDILDLKDVIKNQDEEILELKKEISELTDEPEVLLNTFVAPKTDVYYIKLKKNEIVYFD